MKVQSNISNNTSTWSLSQLPEIGVYFLSIALNQKNPFVFFLSMHGLVEFGTWSLEYLKADSDPRPQFKTYNTALMSPICFKQVSHKYQCTIHVQHEHDT